MSFYRDRLKYKDTLLSQNLFYSLIFIYYKVYYYLIYVFLFRPHPTLYTHVKIYSTSRSVVTFYTVTSFLVLLHSRSQSTHRSPSLVPVSRVCLLMSHTRVLFWSFRLLLIRSHVGHTRLQFLHCPPVLSILESPCVSLHPPLGNYQK